MGGGVGVRVCWWVQINSTHHSKTVKIEGEAASEHGLCVGVGGCGCGRGVLVGFRQTKNIE